MEENLFGIWINGECIELILKNEDNDKVKMINLDNIWDILLIVNLQILQILEKSLIYAEVPPSNIKIPREVSFCANFFFFSVFSREFISFLNTCHG